MVQDCIKDPACIFHDGECITKKNIPQPSSTSPNTYYAEIMINPENFAAKGLRPLQVIVNDQIISSAVDSIKDAHTVAKSIGKKLVIDVLDTPSSKQQLGLWLQYLFSYESVQGPTRWLIYWSLAQDTTFQSTFSLTQEQVIYWLIHPDARPLTQALTSDLMKQWLIYPPNQQNIILPLLEWSLKQDESVIHPLCDIVVDYLPFAREAVVLSLTDSATEALRSPEVRSENKILRIIMHSDTWLHP